MLLLKFKGIYICLSFTTYELIWMSCKQKHIISWIEGLFVCLFQHEIAFKKDWIVFFCALNAAVNLLLCIIIFIFVNVLLVFFFRYFQFVFYLMQNMPLRNIFVWVTNFQVEAKAHQIQLSMPCHNHFTQKKK